MRFFKDYYPDCQTYDLRLGWRQDVFRNLAQGVESTYLGSVDGDIAEFGVGGGGTARLLAEALSIYELEWEHSWSMEAMPPRNLHLFDSFDGYPETLDPTERLSPRVASGYWGKGRNKGLDIDTVKAQCSEHLPASRLYVYPGFFTDVLAELTLERPLALVHLDCNLYESTAEVLDYLFTKDVLADGCALYFDDWNCSRASDRFGQRRAWAECLAKFKPKFSDSGEYANSGHKFIIHPQ